MIPLLRYAQKYAEENLLITGFPNHQAGKTSGLKHRVDLQDKLLWHSRTMRIISSLLHELATNAEINIGSFAKATYQRIVAPHVDWMAKKMVTSALAKAPTRTKLMKNLKTTSVEFMQACGDFDAVLRPLVNYIHTYLVSVGLEKSEIADELNAHVQRESIAMPLTEVDMRIHTANMDASQNTLQKMLSTKDVDCTQNMQTNSSEQSTNSKSFLQECDLEKMQEQSYFETMSTPDIPELKSARSSTDRNILESKNDSLRSPKERTQQNDNLFSRSPETISITASSETESYQQKNQLRPLNSNQRNRAHTMSTEKQNTQQDNPIAGFGRFPTQTRNLSKVVTKDSFDDEDRLDSSNKPIESKTDGSDNDIYPHHNLFSTQDDGTKINDSSLIGELSPNSDRRQNSTQSDNNTDEGAKNFDTNWYIPAVFDDLLKTAGVYQQKQSGE